MDDWSPNAQLTVSMAKRRCVTRISLIRFQRQVAITPDPLLVVWIHDTFRDRRIATGRSSSECPAIVTRATSGSNPSMCSFFCLARINKAQVTILNTHLLDVGIEEFCKSINARQGMGILMISS